MRRASLVAGLALGLVGPGCRGCHSPPDPVPTTSSSATTPTAGRDAPPAVPSALPPHRATAPELARRHRHSILDALQRAREAVAAGRPRTALVTLAKATALDPTGGALAVELSRTAALAGNEGLARDWARRAHRRARGNESVREAAEQAMAAALAKPAPELASRTLGPLASSDEACRQLTRQVNLGQSQALGLGTGDVTSVDCHAGPPHRVGAAQLANAQELRLQIDEGGTTEASWVALQTPQGLWIYGPVARVHGPREHDVVNAFTLRLAHLDALRGGAPEVAVSIDERLTQLDLALNEVLTSERAQLVVLTLDRGGITASPKTTLFERRVVRPIDAEDPAPLPPGYERSQLWNHPDTLRARLRWEHNEIVLTPDATRGESVHEQRILLFP